MKIGFIISLYDEIDVVAGNVDLLKREGCPMVIIQSEPGDRQKILPGENADFYRLLPDIAGSRDGLDEITDEDQTTVKPLARNLSLAFQKASGIGADWWVAILGDVRVSGLDGITGIIRDMEKHQRSLGVTRAVGQTFLDAGGRPLRVQRRDTRDFMPQFFITKGDMVKRGIFHDIRVTNPYTFEQCMGDAAARFFQDNGLDFWQECHSICDFPYPKFIDGVRYNPDRARLPRHVDGIVNRFRRAFRAR